MYKLTIAYDGTDFSGWQQQTNALSIHQCIQNACHHLFQDTSLRVVGSGRTDAGVHATGQVAHLRSPAIWESAKLLCALNALLPKTIRICRVQLVDDSFHAQKSALSKIYHYFLWTTQIVDPLQRLYVWKPPRTINPHLLKEAAQRFVGTKNFKSFANKASSGSAAKNSVRTLSRLDVIDMPSGVRLEFEGSGFLYKMVRNIVGTLVAVASGKLTVDDIDAIASHADRRRAPTAAAARGLCLVQVVYPHPFQ